MSIEIIAFGPLIPILGDGPLRLESRARTAAELLEQLHQDYPALDAWKGRIACAQGEALLRASTPLAAEQSVALIPPVSGG